MRNPSASIPAVTRFSSRALLGLSLAAASAGCGASGARPAAPTATATTTATSAPPAAASGAPAEASNASAARVLAHDEAVTFGAGATFTAPAGWSLTAGPDRVALASPEHDLSLSLLELAGGSADDVIARAWRAVDPHFARTVLHRAAPPARDGWDEIVQLQYATAPSESRYVVAVVLRKGARAYVGLLDGALSGLSRRGPAVQTALETLRAPGVAEESWAGRTAHPLEGERAAAFEQFVRSAMTDEGIPGVAVGVVQGGRLVFSRGFGVRSVGATAPVTPRTLFMIGSNTKSFTTLLMAKLVDERRFRWDTPVTELLPSFRLADAAVTQRMDMQHTVCACTGMPRRDLEFIFEYAHATPEHWLDVLHGMAPTTGFGEVFQYSNLLVAAGGFAAARAVQPRGDLTSATQRALRTEVFAPLGMASTTLEIREALRREHAEPHGRSVRFELARMPIDVERGVESVGPAGAAWSSVEDMARYLELELRRGALPDGHRYVSEAALLERRRPRVRIDEHRSYGLGLIVNDAHGVTAFGHGGNTLGFSSDMVFYPELDLGLVVLTNGAGENAFLSAVQRRLLEVVLDAREEAAERFAFYRADRDRHVAEDNARVEPAPPRDWYAAWLGSYRNADLGALTLLERGGALVLDAGEWSSRVGRERSASGELSLVLLDPPVAGVDFQPPTAAAAGTIVLDYPQSPYRFEREEHGEHAAAR